MKHYYKICRVVDDKFYSMNIPYEHIPSMNVEYKLGKWIKPNLERSRLFAYYSFDKAMLDFTFANMYISKNKFAMFECKVRNPILANTDVFQSNSILERWKSFPDYRKIPIKRRFPNCVVATEIMLIERIE